MNIEKNKLRGKRSKISKMKDSLQKHFARGKENDPPQTFKMIAIDQAIIKIGEFEKQKLEKLNSFQTHAMQNRAGRNIPAFSHP